MQAGRASAAELQSTSLEVTIAEFHSCARMRQALEEARVEHWAVPHDMLAQRWGSGQPGGAVLTEFQPSLALDHPAGMRPHPSCFNFVVERVPRIAAGEHVVWRMTRCCQKLHRGKRAHSMHKADLAALPAEFSKAYT